MRPKDFQSRLDDHPFKPFRVHVSDGSTLVVSDPGMVIIGRTTVVVPSRYGVDEDGVRIAENWRTVALMHITQFSDVDESRNGRRGRRTKR